MKIIVLFVAMAIAILIPNTVCYGQSAATADQLERLLKQYPAADANRDGKLTRAEATAYRNKLTGKNNTKGQTRSRGIKRDFKVDPGWDNERFPDQAMCYKTPAEIKAAFERATSGKQPSVVSYPKPTDGGLRVLGIGHSFMAPGYKTLPLISKAAGMEPCLYTHVSGGMTGSARYKWEQENGIFQFAGKPFPKLLASIAGAEWDAMMFGPYYNDRPIYYSCWIDFCLKYNPNMKFYLSDAWPQLEHLGENPKSEEFFTEEMVERWGQIKRPTYARTLDPLLKKYPGKVFLLPTSDAMVLAAKHYVRGELPGIEGLHRVIGKKERSLWRDQLGHLGQGLERLEGYVFYATLYKQSPERIENAIEFGGGTRFPSPELDQVFRKIAWQAVVENPFSGVSDSNEDKLQ